MIMIHFVDSMGPTPGCPACHKQMLGEARMGVSHAEECRSRHETTMSREKGPRFERAFEHLLQYDEEVMRRKIADRQANEDREERNIIITLEGLRGERAVERNVRQPWPASSGPYVPGEGRCSRGKPRTPARSWHVLVT